jgi:hypothetical protein
LPQEAAVKVKECSHCGYIGKPVHDEYSSILIDVIAWTFCLIAVAITANLYILALGAVVSIWHLLTFRSHRCPRCGDWDMHRISSPHLH